MLAGDDFETFLIFPATASTMATRVEPALVDPRSNSNGLANQSSPKKDSEEQKFAKAEKERNSRRKQTCADQVHQDLIQHYMGIENGPPTFCRKDHGHQDWRVCRYERRSTALQLNCKQYLGRLRRERASDYW